MTREYSALAHHRLPSGVRVATPAPESRLSLESPALEAMTDLRAVKAAVIGPDRRIDECNVVMVARAIRLLFVQDAQADIVGVITATDLLGDKPVRFMHERGVRHHEVRVLDVMTPSSEMEALDLAEVSHSQVGQIVATLKSAGRQHTFVTDSGRARICGLFSATHIARRLGMEVQTHEVAGTFAQIEAALR